MLVLTERTEHLDAIKTALDGQVPAPFVLHGRMSKKQRAALIAELEALPPDAPRVLLATGKLVGEGFDHPPDPGQASRAALRTLPLGLARPAHQARVVRFMPVSGLRPYGRRWEFKLRDIAPSLVSLADHPMLRRDRDGGLVVTVEPYADVGDGIHYALEAWARYRGWQYQVTDARAAMRNPDMGRPSRLLAPHRESPRWRQTSYPGHWHSG